SPAFACAPLSGQIVVAKFATTPAINSGDPVSYLITVQNLNPTTNGSGTLSDTLPAGATWTQPAGCTLDAPTRALQCNIVLPKNGGTIGVSVTGTHTAGGCANLVNTASASTTVGNGS